MESETIKVRKKGNLKPLQTACTCCSDTVCGCNLFVHHTIVPDEKHAANTLTWQFQVWRAVITCHSAVDLIKTELAVEKWSLQLHTKTSPFPQILLTFLDAPFFRLCYQATLTYHGMVWFRKNWRNLSWSCFTKWKRKEKKMNHCNTASVCSLYFVASWPRFVLIFVLSRLSKPTWLCPE